MKKQTWSTVKSALPKESQALIKVIAKLYQLNKENKQFLQTHLDLDTKDLSSYKQTIERYLCPDIFANEVISISKAKKAISNYRKAKGKPEDIAELEVYSCECIINFSYGCCIEDEPTIDSFVRLFERAVKATLKTKGAKQKKLIRRLLQVVHETKDWGWGVPEDFDMIIKKYELPLV